MAQRIIRFGDERDLCFNCQRPVERCGDAQTVCTYTEATKDCRELRHKSEKIQHSEGIPEPYMDHWDFGYN